MRRFKKAAVYFEALANYHAFVDGNKRTAFAATVRFLYINGLEFSATNKNVETLVLQVVAEKLDLETITEWFEKHSK